MKCFLLRHTSIHLTLRWKAYPAHFEHNERMLELWCINLYPCMAGQSDAMTLYAVYSWAASSQALISLKKNHMESPSWPYDHVHLFYYAAVFGHLWLRSGNLLIKTVEWFILLTPFTSNHFLSREQGQIESFQCFCCKWVTTPYFLPHTWNWNIPSGSSLTGARFGGNSTDFLFDLVSLSNRRGGI